MNRYDPYGYGRVPYAPYRRAIPAPRYESLVRFGQNGDPAPPAQQEPQPQQPLPPTPAEQQNLIDRWKEGLRQVTPTLLLVGAASGFAFAVGSGLGSAFVERYILGRRREG